MAESAATSATSRARVLCLGNDILADDGIGIEVARRLRGRGGEIEIVESMESGFRLLDHFLDVRWLVVVDAVETGGAPPGTVYVLQEEDLVSTSGTSPHYVGLQETMSLARGLGLPVASEVVVVAVEVADARTVGGAMHPAVEEAVAGVVSLVESLVADGLTPLDECLSPSGGLA